MTRYKKSAILSLYLLFRLVGCNREEKLVSPVYLLSKFYVIAMCYHCELVLHVCLTVCVVLSVCSCLKILLPCSRRQIAISEVCLAWIGPQPLDICASKFFNRYYSHVSSYSFISKVSFLSSSVSPSFEAIALWPLR